MTLLYASLLFGSLVLTFSYIVSTLGNALTGGSWVARLLIACLFFFFDLVLADALNIIF